MTSQAVEKTWIGIRGYRRLRGECKKTAKCSKMQENSLSGIVNLFKGVNVIDVRTKWFRNFCRFKLLRVNFVPREPKLV